MNASMPSSEKTAAPVDQLLYAPDLRRVRGRTLPLGEYRITEEEIRSFAERWDPLPIHLGNGAEHFGTLIASGLHTLAVFQYLAVRAVYSRWAIFAARAVRDIELLHPVHPGDVLSGDITLLSVGPDRNGRAKAVVRGRLRNQHDRIVLTVEVESYVHSDPAQRSATARRSEDR